jgi:hypothetical protein
LNLRIRSSSEIFLSTAENLNMDVFVMSKIHRTA